MPNVQVDALVDAQGRIVAAKVGGERLKETNQDLPTATFRPLEGQRYVTFEIPAEAVALAGNHLERFFSHVSVNWPVEAIVPDIEVIRLHAAE